jgi:ligand-binding sensor domain-containing protein/signal transduction histidine kinase
LNSIIGQFNPTLPRAIGFLLISLALLAPPIVAGQRERLRFERLSGESGLPQSSILCICQDSRGFLWFGTYDGLERYDGFQFKTFKHNSDDSTSLSQNLVRDIFEDREGILWIGTEHGLCRYNRTTETFTSFFEDAGNSAGISSSRIRRIFQDREGELWITTEDGLNRYDRERNRFVAFRNDPGDPRSLASNFIRAIGQGIEGTLWVGTSKGLDAFDKATGTFTHMSHDPADPGSLSDNAVSTILEDRAGTLWVGTQHGGLNRLERRSSNFVHYKFDANDPGSIRADNISQILEDRSGDLWIGTYGGGLEHFDHKTDSFTHHQKDYFDPASLSSDQVYCLFEDKGGVLYVGTDFGSVNKLDWRKNRFAWHRHDPHDPGSLGENNVNAIYEDPADGGRTMWIGTQGGGLDRLDRRTDQFAHWRHSPATPASLSDDVVRCVLRDSRGALWVGTNNGLNRYDARTGSFVHYMPNPTDPFSLRHNTVMCLYEDQAHTLWVGTVRGGLEEYAPQRDGFIHHTFNPNNSTSISDDYIWCILEDHAGALWIGTNNGGLNRFSRHERRFTRFTKDPRNPESISDNKVLCLFEDKGGTLWIGTAGGGLNRYSTSEGRFIKYGVESGLPATTIHAIVGDPGGNLWISTPRGICKFDPARRTSVSLDAHDGLQGNEFHVNAACASRTGELYFGGINGINVFRPERVEQNSSIPQIALTDFHLFNRPVAPGKVSDGRILLDSCITEKRRLVLTHRDEVFTLDFAALDFSAPEKNQFAYRMDGFDNDWNVVGNRHFATYTRLPAGEYVFRVMGSNNSGLWDKTGASLVIIVEPPLWHTWWFRAFVAFLIIGSLILLYILRTRAIVSRTRELEQRVQERTAQLQAANKELEAFAFSVSHDLRAPLRAIDGFSEILAEDYAPALDDEGRKVIGVVRKEVTRMGQLIEDLLAFSRFNQAEMHSVEINMNALVLRVFEEITSSEQRKRIDFSITQLPTAVGDPALIRQVLANLLSNAVKFSSRKPRAVIGVDGRVSNGEVVYSIKDNGAGFQNEYAGKMFGVFQRLHKADEFEGTGVGLAIVQRLIHRHGGRVWGEGVLNEGATFSFTLPRS